MLAARTWLVPTLYPQRTETMVDDVGNDGRFRACYHTSSSWEFDAPILSAYNYCSHAGNSYAYEVLKAHVDPSLSLLTAPTPNMNELANEAAAYMMPRLNEGTSLVNFLIELKDFKRMISPSQFRTTSRWTALRHLRDPRSRKRFIKDLTNKLTGAHLNASFGIVPFVKDLVQMYDDLSLLRERIARLKKFAGIRQYRHYRRVLPGNDGEPTTKDRKVSIQTDTWSDPWRGDGAFVAAHRPAVIIKQWANWVQRPVYHATMRYEYTLPSVSEAEETIMTHLDALGVRLDPSIIWNAIPFSFLVDWVVDVSGFLRSFARDNFPITTKIHEFCHSISYSRLCGVDCVVADRATLSPRPSSPLGVHQACVARNFTKYYNRMLVTPDLHTVNVRGPTLRQAALSGSLLLNNNRRIYRWAK